jgi:hypothetical protein
MTSTDTRPRSHLLQGALDDGSVVGEFVTLEDEEMYVIRGFDQMPAFLMSIVSDSDHWMYASTKGGIAAGRVVPDRSLFPYETDDRLYRAGGVTGPFTLVRVHRSDGEFAVWEPFTDGSKSDDVERNLYKSIEGNSVVFEELRHDLGLAFRYRWSTSSSYGFIRTSTLIREDRSDVERVEVLDGLLNLMPANVPLGLQQTSSTLVEAYRRNEVDPATRMAIYSLESRITDRAEPAESMVANIVWSTGLPDPEVLITSNQIPDFRAGRTLQADDLTKGVRGHYLLSGSIEFDAAGAASWLIVADVHQSQLKIEERRAQLLSDTDLITDIKQHVSDGTDRLRSLIDSADGSQCTADRMATAHHFANTLFNAMRGGVFVDNGAVPVADLSGFLETRNRAVFRAHADWLASLGERIGHRELLANAAERGDPDLERLCHEYLPITFSRRHGDPSRPWNMFAIRVRDAEGNRVLDYQGNWRDIFQNWEALCYSFPDYLESIVAKFLNASTVDGFNPYRVTRNGIDWEVPDPEDAWSNIGYWGDHQIVYLLRLLEASEAFHPGALHDLLDRELFSYADVPYRLRPYDAIVRNSKSTIDYDHARGRDIEDRSAFIGSDGRLMLGADNNVLHVTMAEKLLVPALSKLANLVVEGGIWMNTQRPEWNDANNALVGYGASMVTLSYLRRYLEFCERLIAENPATEYVVSAEVADWLNETASVLTAYLDRLDQPTVSDRRRKRILDNVAHAFAAYRDRVYEQGFSGKATVTASTIIELCRAGRLYADHSIRANRRDSGLYHSYNLVHIEDDGREIRVEHLPEMLEGQVAALSSGVMTFDEVLEIVDALFESKLYREDQDSFMLYPAQELPSFLDRNTIDASDVASSPLLSGLIDDGETSLIVRDAFGVYRFASSITSVESLSHALDHLSASAAWTDLVAAHRSRASEIFEDVFHHERFTGRSGSMYKYEGLGSIYWHMVSKLLLAVQESYWKARAAGEDVAVLERLGDAYYRIRAGLSSDKTPQQYGAFPMDPYSHSPGHMGAQQPGMTGQVKEEILTRWGELGLRVEAGALRFDPALLRRREFLDAERPWTFVDATGSFQTITLPPRSLGFTYCQVPIVYRLVEDGPEVTVTSADGTTSHAAGHALESATSAAVFERRTSIALVEVAIPTSTITRN